MYDTDSPTGLYDDTYCDVHAVRRCTICAPPMWLFPQPVTDEAVSEA